jgi:hypothetical protein
MATQKRGYLKLKEWTVFARRPWPLMCPVCSVCRTISTRDMSNPYVDYTGPDLRQQDPDRRQPGNIGQGIEP